MTRWLVRTTTNEIHGPFRQEQLVQAIQAGRWDLRDEACRENHYWFSFHEAQELQAQLGISWPGTGAAVTETEERTDEITDTQTVTLAEEVGPRAGRHAGAEDGAPDRLSAESKPASPWWVQPEFLVVLLLAAAGTLAFFLSR